MDGITVRDCRLVFGNMGTHVVTASKTMEAICQRYIVALLLKLVSIHNSPGTHCSYSAINSPSTHCSYSAINCSLGVFWVLISVILYMCMYMYFVMHKHYCM